MVKAISISINPNFERDDIDLVRNLWWRKVDCVGATGCLREKIENYFSDEKKVIITESGRDGLYLVLKAMGVGNGDEIIVQAFTCSVVPNAVLNLGAKVVYVDIDDEYNLDLRQLKRKINCKTKAVIVQHTFGCPVKMDEVRRIVGNEIKIIEDLAHGLGNSYKGQKLGLWGDAAVLSFGRDKVISGIWGGAIMADKKLVTEINKLTKQFPKRDDGWVRRHLEYILWSDTAIGWYGVGIGKVMHWLAKKEKWFSEPLSIGEKRGEKKFIYKGLPDELGMLVLNQWKKLDKYVENRKKIAKIYQGKLGWGMGKSSFLRYSIEVDDPIGLRAFAAKKNMFLGDWYDQVVAPKSVNVNMFGYISGMCPKAEEKSKRIVNLPTNPNLTDRDIKKVISIIKEWKSKK